MQHREGTTSKGNGQALPHAQCGKLGGRRDLRGALQQTRPRCERLIQAVQGGQDALDHQQPMRGLIGPRLLAQRRQLRFAPSALFAQLFQRSPHLLLLRLGEGIGL